MQFSLEKRLSYGLWPLEWKRGQAMPSKREIFTIGHSTHSLEEFLSLLNQHRIKALVDIRRFPGSRKFPQFNQDELSSTLQKAGIEYHWLEVLGGRRSKKKDSSTVNLGLHNPGFRNYADYMLTEEFQSGIACMMEIAKDKRTSLMCAEGLFWRCHRRLVSDFLHANGLTIQHIMPSGELRPHSLTPGAVVENERITYPGDKTGAATNRSP